jgi:serine protease Do
VVIATTLVLTNAHNLHHDELAVTFVDGRSESGRLAGSDPDLDLAVISVDTGELEPLDWAAPAGGDYPPIGRAVLALANPGGRGLRVTPGFVSGTARSFRGPRGRRIPGAIEHTAPLPRGSSGGPLLDTDGRLLAINTVRVEGGLILAITLDAAMRRRIDGLARGEAPNRGRLGILIMPPRAARKLRHAVGLPERDGILIRGVEDDSPASRAGLQRGDLIVAAAGRVTDRLDALHEALDAARGAGEIELTLVRGAEERTVTARF